MKRVGDDMRRVGDDMRRVGDDMKRVSRTRFLRFIANCAFRGPSPNKYETIIDIIQYQMRVYFTNNRFRFPYSRPHVLDYRKPKPNFGYSITIHQPINLIFSVSAPSLW